MWLLNSYVSVLTFAGTRYVRDGVGADEVEGTRHGRGVGRLGCTAPRGRRSWGTETRVVGRGLGLTGVERGCRAWIDWEGSEGRRDRYVVDTRRLSMDGVGSVAGFEEEALAIAAARGARCNQTLTFFRQAGARLTPPRPPPFLPSSATTQDVHRLPLRSHTSFSILPSTHPIYLASLYSAHSITTHGRAVLQLVYTIPPFFFYHS